MNEYCMKNVLGTQTLFYSYLVCITLFLIGCGSESADPVKVSSTVLSKEKPKDTLKPAGKNLIPLTTIVAPSRPEEGDTTVYTVMGKMPMYCGGKTTYEKGNCPDISFSEALRQHLKFKRIGGEKVVSTFVLLSLIIEKDGSVSNIKIEKGDNYTLLEKVKKGLPKWVPGKQNGINLRTKMIYGHTIKW